MDRRKALERVAEAARETVRLIRSLEGFQCGTLHPNDFATRNLEVSLSALDAANDSEGERARERRKLSTREWWDTATEAEKEAHDRGSDERTEQIACVDCVNPDVGPPVREPCGSETHWHHYTDPGDGLAHKCPMAVYWEEVYQEGRKAAEREAEGTRDAEPDEGPSPKEQA